MADSLHGLRTFATEAASLPSGPLRVVIAEGQSLVRARLRMLLDRQHGIVTAGEVAASDDVVAAVSAVRPDVVLMDVDLPGAGGLETTRRLLAEVPAGATRVLMLVTAASDDVVFGALRAGADGVLLKDAVPAELVAAVRAVADGDAVLAPELARHLVVDFCARPRRLRVTPAQLDELTAREHEVVRLVACGLSNDEIAEQLVITRSTAKTHVSRALCKLHARDRAQLVVLAYEAGLVCPGAPRAAGPARHRHAPMAHQRSAAHRRRPGLHALAA